MNPIPYRPPSLAPWSPGDPVPSIYAWQEVFPFLQPVLDATPQILDELRQHHAESWYPWPEKNLYAADKGQSWTVIPFCHTFPGNDPSATKWIDTSVATYPVTTSILRAIPGLRTALVSRLGPSMVLKPHTGWAALSNHVLRCHLGIKVPSPPTACGICVGDSIAYHKTGELLVFDDSQVHTAFNRHPTEDRIILLFDIARPSQVAPGSARGEETVQLTDFIDAFTIRD
jgi:aspartyl/asparaginyl beta-hydroxylase (cupin superfamily)